MDRWLWFTAEYNHSWIPDCHTILQSLKLHPNPETHPVYNLSYLTTTILHYTHPSTTLNLPFYFLCNIWCNPVTLNHHNYHPSLILQPLNFFQRLWGFLDLQSISPVGPLLWVWCILCCFHQGPLGWSREGFRVSSKLMTPSLNIRKPKIWGWEPTV